MGGTPNSSGGILQSYQYRIGGEYYPAAPVELSLTPSGNVSNGGTEAWLELQKALNIVGDYRLSSAINVLRWHMPLSADSRPEKDFTYTMVSGDYVLPQYPQEAGNAGSHHFAAAISLEATNGTEISGLNAQEQSDITFMARYSAPQEKEFEIIVFAYIDKMIILRENNVMEMVE